MGFMFFWVKNGNAFAYFVVSCLLARWRYYSILISKQSIFDCKMKLCLGRQENIFSQKKVSTYKVGLYLTISLNWTHLFLAVNTST